MVCRPRLVSDIILDCDLRHRRHGADGGDGDLLELAEIEVTVDYLAPCAEELATALGADRPTIGQLAVLKRRLIGPKLISA